MNIKDLNSFLESYTNQDQMRPTDYEESIEELVKRHLTKIDETWKSPHNIPKQTGDQTLSTEILVRVAGTRGIGIDRYNFEIQDFAEASRLGLKVTGWNYMTKGLYKALKNYFNQIKSTLTIKECQERVGEIYKIFDHFDDSKFTLKERWNIPTIRELAHSKFYERFIINESYIYSLKRKEEEKRLEEMRKAREKRRKEEEEEWTPDWIFPVCVF